MISFFVPVPSAVLAALRPNDVLKLKFQEGYRMGAAAARGLQNPRGVHAYGTFVGLVRKLTARTFAPHVGCLEAVVPRVMTLGLCAPELICDDDAWLFLAKPVLDGIADAAGWKKDRRKIETITGYVDRVAHSHGIAVGLAV